MKKDVIPAKAGIHFALIQKTLDPLFRGDDGKVVAGHHPWAARALLEPFEGPTLKPPALPADIYSATISDSTTMSST